MHGSILTSTNVLRETQMTFDEWKENCIKTFPGSPENVNKLAHFLDLFKIKERLIDMDSVRLDYPHDGESNGITYSVFEQIHNGAATNKYTIRFIYNGEKFNIEMLNTNSHNIHMAINTTIERYRNGHKDM